MSKLYEYQQDLSALRFTPEQKAKLAAEAAAAAQRQTRRTRRPIGRTLLAAACIAAVLVVSAGASGVLKTAVESFSGIFGGSVAQTEVIDKIGHPHRRQRHGQRRHRLRRRHHRRRVQRRHHLHLPPGRRHPPVPRGDQ
ncbi:hypothetical protein [uncultured Dysosmobacter sp.]|uniref:hypothetical protein n=1 Tax=uncultured Dysosmobacter sp. TaxID=2591384 RepID=UPI0026336769|nr:hypothetical protein [uncultured Dysosmobacter sp.]